MLIISGLVGAASYQTNEFLGSNKVLEYFVCLSLPFDSVWACECVCVCEREQDNEAGRKLEKKKSNVLSAHHPSGRHERLLPPEAGPDPNRPRPHLDDQLSRVNPSPRSAQIIRPPVISMRAIFRSLTPSVPLAP